MAVRGSGTVVLGVSVYPEQAEAMRASAARNERSLSAEFRRAIRSYLAVECADAEEMSPVAIPMAPGSTIAMPRDHAER